MELEEEDKSCLNTNPRHRSVKQNTFKTCAVPPRVHTVDRSIHSDDSEGIPSGPRLPTESNVSPADGRCL